MIILESRMMAMALALALALAIAVAMAMAMAMAMATAMAVIRPEHAEGGRNHENRLFNEKLVFRPILVISGLSRRQKWIQLKISGRMLLLRGLESTIQAFS